MADSALSLDQHWLMKAQDPCFLPLELALQGLLMLFQTKCFRTFWLCQILHLSWGIEGDKSAMCPRGWFMLPSTTVILIFSGGQIRESFWGSGMNYGLKGNEHAYNIFYIISELLGTTLNSSMDTLRRSMDLWFKKKNLWNLEYWKEARKRWERVAL